MNAFNRLFSSLAALAWCAGWARATYLMWTPDGELRTDNRYMDFLFDIGVSGSDRILATLIAGAAIVVGMGLLAAQIMPRRERRPDHETVTAGDGRYRELHERIESLQRQVNEREADRRAIAPGEPVPVREMPGAPRRRWTLLNRERR